MRSHCILIFSCILLLAGGSFAAGGSLSANDGEIRPIASKCALKNGVVRCTIAQSDSKATLIDAGYADSDVKTLWNTFVSDLEGQMNPYVGDDNSLYLTFETDIDLGGYVEAKKECYGYGTAFEPINFHTLFKNVVIDGGNHTIKNYCDISIDVNPSFFRKIRTNVTIKDLAFDNAYVLAKIEGTVLREAAVVADEVSGNVKAVFENVKVTNSKVYSWNAGTILGTAACNSDTACPEIKFSGVKVENVDLGLNEAYFEDNAQFLSHSYSLWANRVSYRGGLAAHVWGSAEFTNDTASNLRIVEDFSLQIQSRVAYTRFGGFVGGIKPSLNADHNKFSLRNSVVDAEIRGTIVGGLIGYVESNTLAEKSDLEISNAKVTLNSGDYTGKSDKRNMGGLLGYFQWKNGNVSLLKNKVEAKFVCVNPNVGTKGTQMGGLIGQFIAQDNDVAPVNINVEDNNVTAEIDTKEPILYVGGLAGNIVANVKSDFSIKNDTVSAEIKTTADALYGGGILGYADLSRGGSLIVKNTVVKPVKLNLIAASNEMMENIEVGLVIGQAMSSYNYDGVVNVSENRARGDIKIAATSLTKTIMSSAGGLLGMVQAGETTVANNVTQGNLDVPKNGGLDGKFFLGYVVGYPVLYKTLTIRNNYHYGSTDVNADLAVGTIHTTSIDIPYTTWKTTGAMDTYDVRYNYRNAVKTLKAEGELALDGSGLIVSGSNKFYDGVISEDAMKSRLFTYVMNATQLDDQNPVLWENRTSMPIFSDTRTAYRLAISLLNEDYKELTANDKAALKDYLPVEQCEAGVCSLYVYTDKDAKLPSLRSTFDDMEAGFMLIDKVSSENSYGVFDYGQTFTQDKTVIGVTDREIEVEYTMFDLDESGYVPVDKYADHVTFAWPRVDKIRLISGKGVVPVILLDTDDANGSAPEYELNFDYAENPCIDGVNDANCLPNAFYSSSTRSLKKMDAFEDILRNVRKGFNSIHQNKIVLSYLPFELSREKGYLPRIEVGVVGLDAEINMTTYAYNGKGEPKEKDSFEIKKEQSGVDMVSKYQFSLTERGFILNDWWVDFWIDLDTTSTDDIKSCYNEGSMTARCAQASAYGDPTKNYFNSESDIEIQLNASNAGNLAVTHRLLKWSTKLAPDEKLDLDSLIQGLASIGLKRASERAIFMGVTPRLKSAILYTVNFDVNADGKNVFLTDRLTDTEIYSRENDETARLPVVLATDACFMGWDKKSDGQAVPLGTNYHTSLDGSLLAAANPNDEESFAVYGNWVPAGSGGGNKVSCNPSSTTIELSLRDKADEEADLGTAALWQSYQKLGIETEKFVHEFEDGKLEIPTSAEQMTFHVSLLPNDSYKLGQLTLVTSYADTMMEDQETPISFRAGKDTVFSVSPSVDVSYKLIAKFCSYYNVALDLNERDVVFYGDDSRMDSVQVGEIGNVDVPEWIYTVDSCVGGWSMNKTAQWGDADVYGIPVDAEKIYDAAVSSKVLYAVWAGADQCVEQHNYNRVMVETDHGTVQIIETSKQSNVSIVHTFAADGSMILPEVVEDTEMKLRVKVEKGYKLDSVVVVVKDKFADDDVELYRFSLKSGDVLPMKYGNMYMKAYFSEYDSDDGMSELVYRNLLQSGNAVRFAFDSATIAKNKLVWFHLVLEKEGVGVDSADVRCDTQDCTKGWEKYPLAGGSYLLTVEIRDSTAVYSFEKTFDVATEIAVGRKGMWHMVALSDVAMDSLKWDDDEKIYWWKEEQKYGSYWQYQEFTKKQTPEQGRGYWYNSLEGRPLKLKEEGYAGDVVWKLDSVYTGWNLVANPYGWYMDVGVPTWEKRENELRANGASEEEINEAVLNYYPPVEFLRWNSAAGRYDPVDTLAPYEAVWVRSNDPELKEWFPSTVPAYIVDLNGGDSTTKSHSRSLAKSVKGVGWNLQLILSDANGKEDCWNTLGVGKQARVSDEPPPGMGDRVNLSIVEGGKRLAKSVKVLSEDAAYEWNIELSATSKRKGFLDIAGADALIAEGMHVYVVIDGKTVEAREGEKIPVDLSTEAKVALVRVASAPKKVVAQELHGLRVVQVGDGLQVSFDAKDLGGSKARVDVFDMKGSVVASTSLLAVEGRNMLTIDVPRRGLYMVRVAVAGLVDMRRVMLR